jgi:hypothetical protein
MRRPGFASMIVAALACPALPMAAAGLDGSGPVTCATSVTFDCAPNGECIKDSPEAINLPRLIRLDLPAKKAFTKWASGEERSAEIASQSVEGGRLILQGIQNGNGWSLTVAQESGAMSLAIAGDGAAIIAFGVCQAY